MNETSLCLETNTQEEKKHEKRWNGKSERTKKKYYNNTINERIKGKKVLWVIRSGIIPLLYN